MVTETKIIKSVLASIMEEEGFKYMGKKKEGDFYWIYGRQDGEWMQYIYVVRHGRKNEIWIEIDEKKLQEAPLDNAGGFGLRLFTEEVSIINDRRKKYINEETFTLAVEELRQLVIEYFLPGFMKLRRPRYKYCVTEEMQRKVYEEGETLLKDLEIYHIGELREDKMLYLIIQILKEYKHKNMEEFSEMLLMLSALWGENIVQNLKNYQWKWEAYYGKCNIVRNMKEYATNPISTIFDTWVDGVQVLKNSYRLFFVERRKEDKSLENWDLKVQKKGFREWDYMDKEILLYGAKQRFLYDSWIGKEDGWRLSRVRKGTMQKIWIKRNTGTGEIWIKAGISEDRYVEVRDYREGLAPYKGSEYCHQNDSVRFPKILDKLLKQLETEFLPMLENEEEYLLKYELTPEMEESQFYDRKELLEKLAQRYPINDMKKDELPEFVKKVLRENEEKSMEEFGPTLLGLGVLLGESAINGKKERHWLWDKVHAACIVTSGDEVH